MRLPLTFLAAAVAASVPALEAPAQPPAKAASGLGILAELTGEWDGEAWMIRGPEGRATYRQREWVTLAAGGTVITVIGRGTHRLPDGTDRVIHDAFAVIHRNRENTGIAMRAFTAEGHWLDPEIQLQERGYLWSMTDPRIGMIRYDMQIDDQGRWVEKGLLSRDSGKTWMQFMEMTLRRVK
jgi:hypothetical protein